MPFRVYFSNVFSLSGVVLCGGNSLLRSTEKHTARQRWYHFTHTNKAKVVAAASSQFFTIYFSSQVSCHKANLFCQQDSQMPLLSEWYTVLNLLMLNLSSWRNKERTQRNTVHVFLQTGRHKVWICRRLVSGLKTTRISETINLHVLTTRTS